MLYVLNFGGVYLCNSQFLFGIDFSEFARPVFSAMALRAPLMKNSPRAELASSEREMEEFRDVDVGVLHM